MTHCTRCTRDVPHPCPSDEHAQFCTRRPERFAIGDVAYVVEGEEYGNYNRGDRVTIVNVLPPQGALQPVHLQVEGRGGRYYAFTRQLSRTRPVPELPMCQFCGTRVAVPCGRASLADRCDFYALSQLREGDHSLPIRTTVGNLLGTTPTGIAEIERDMAEATAEQVRRTVEIEQQRATATARFGGVGATRGHRCAQCDRMVARPCESREVAFGCVMPDRVLDEMNWMPGDRLVNVSEAVQYAAAERAGRIRRRAEDTMRRPGFSMTPPHTHPPVMGYCVRNGNGQMDIRCCMPTRQGAIVSYLVIVCGFNPEHDVVNDWDTVSDAWNNGPAAEGARVEPIMLVNPRTEGMAEHAWQPIDTAPRDRVILVYAPGAEHGLPDLQCTVQWHQDGGFCVCELRQAEWWRPLPEGPASLENRRPAATPSPWNVVPAPLTPEPPRDPAPRRRAIRALRIPT